MHELSLAQSLLDMVVQVARSNQAARIAKIGISMGAFTHVAPDSLIFCFDLVKEDTEAAQAVLEIKKVPVSGRCLDCKKEISFSEPVFTCPYCSSDRVEVDKGQELMVDYIEVDEAPS
ncbi:hydrogenase maturation nickel metallochaperone HypA [Dethiosulfatarculus sandiegensis]|uniref:Hydrogenase maturation factor HypA n=1 Tax=Dethiosulfatarculus sandiegensis TaxID=1429043 RepID=A0A0D2HW36_9BACT|nr:hydrogenase maturation nickel metallochaperone HypA [Dethiosulfatarculus sandiegensis]KIX14588.1 hydrogenase expression protein [Dethiosulfatarculus sandiegensis]